jgi:hypothetical protein
MRKSCAVLSLCIFFSFLIAFSTSLTAQNANPLQEDTGWNAYTSLQGSTNSQEGVLKLDNRVGYDFNRHFGVGGGVPIYFAHTSTSTTSGGTSTAGVGNVYLDARVKFLNPAINYGSVLTLNTPTGDSKKGLSTGRATYDWSNRFDRSFDRLTPFFEIGVSNTIADTRFFTRPFTTLGTNTHFEGGASYDLWRFLSAGASLYDVLPSGQQKVFSKLVNRGSAGGVDSGKNGRVFEQNAETVGGADIARDNGFSTWIDASPSKYLDFELGYTRSVHYDLNTVSFGIGVNVGKLAKRARK